MKERGVTEQRRCNRRAFLQALGAAAVTAAVPERRSVAKRPNVLFLYTDDQTFDSIHALGNNEIQTPNMDRLVARGTAFRNCYNPGGWHGAICVASRTMLNTGLFLWEAMPLEKEPRQLAMQPLWGNVWRAQGYLTYLTGKWHVNVPPKLCFEKVEHVRPGMPKSVESAYLRPKPDGSDTWSPYDKSLGGHWEGGTHWAEVGANDAIAFLKEAPRDRPFFAYVAFNAPHDPRQAPKEYVDLYPPEKIALPKNFVPEFPAAKTMGAPATLRDERLAPTPRTPHAVQVHRAEYYALISYLDAQIGRILDALRAEGLEENTLVVLAGDNGLSVGHHGLMGKQNMFEPSMKVPMVLAGPGIPKGEQRSALVYLQDLRPTLFALAGLQEDARVNAFRSFDALLKPGTGETIPFRREVYGAYMRKQRMLRRGPWKITWFFGGRGKPGIWGLYNVVEDPDECRNLANDPAQQQRVQVLKQALLDEMRRVHDPLKLDA